VTGVQTCALPISSDFGPLVAGSGARGFISKGELSGAAIAELL